MRLIRARERRLVEGKGYSKKVLLTSEQIGLAGALLQEVSFQPGENVPSHHHSVQTEIFYALTEVRFEINGEEVILQPADIMICEPGDRHGNPHIPFEMRILVLKIDYREDDTIWDES